MNELPRTLKVVTTWLLIGLALFVGVQWWLQRERQARFQIDGTAIEIHRGPDGHYRWPGEINGRAVEFLVDTGATGTAVPAALARELGLATLGEVESSTAGGVVTGQVVRADVSLRGGVRAQRLRVLALPGLQGDPLLGMDVLGRLHLRQLDGVLHVEASPGR